MGPPLFAGKAGHRRRRKPAGRPPRLRRPLFPPSPHPARVPLLTCFLFSLRASEGPRLFRARPSPPRTSSYAFWSGASPPTKTSRRPTSPHVILFFLWGLERLFYRVPGSRPKGRHRKTFPTPLLFSWSVFSFFSGVSFFRQRALGFFPCFALGDPTVIWILVKGSSPSLEFSSRVLHRNVFLPLPSAELVGRAAAFTLLSLLLSFFLIFVLWSSR